MRFSLCFLAPLGPGSGFSLSPEYTTYPQRQTLSRLDPSGRLSQRMHLELGL
jgi:hypothetical protein